MDRGGIGSKIHVLTDRAGLPLVTGVSGAHTHDSQALKPLVMGIPAILGPHGRRRRRARELHGDKAYDAGHLRHWSRARGITPRIARTGIDPPPGWDDTAGPSNAPCPGSPATDASTAATNATAPYSPRSSASPPP